MTRRGRSSGNAISLFAFQDIITSVTAIIIVMVLFLAMELVERDAVSAAPEHSTSSAELSQALADAEAELAELQSSAREVGALIQEVAESSPAQLQHEIEKLQRLIEQRKRELEAAHEQSHDLDEVQKRVAAEKFDQQPRMDRIDDLRRQSRELQRTLEREKVEGRVIYKLPKGFQKAGWLAVVEADRIIVAPLGRPAPPVEFVGKVLGRLTGATASGLFLSWLKREGNPYVLYLVRPSGGELFDELSEKLVSRRHDFGFDVIGAAEVVLHPQRGAFPE